jgi:hypothetical protein
MPRAEVPEGVERFEPWCPQDADPCRDSDASMLPDEEGAYIAMADLPKLYQHWLDQLKEELGEPFHTLASTIGRARINLAEPHEVDKALGELRDAADAVGQLRVILASIPIEGEEGS